jgi:hypothetical protein
MLGGANARAVASVIPTASAEITIRMTFTPDNRARLSAPRYPIVWASVVKSIGLRQQAIEFYSIPQQFRVVAVKIEEAKKAKAKA